MSKDNGTYDALFKKYSDDGLKQKLELYALWTIPSVFPKNDTRVVNGNVVIEHDYQSVGAMQVNKLATKLATSLFPANSAFFRIEASAALTAMLDDVSRGTEAKKTLVELENSACRRLLYNASYAQLVQAVRLLIITGDVLLKRYDERIRVFSLKNYALRRNNVGEVQDIIIKECIDYAELPVDLRTALGQGKEPDDKVFLYTRVQKQYIDVAGTRNVIWEETQEVEGHRVDFRNTYTEKLCPYVPVVWNYVNGDNYGRGYVEEYAGDFAKLSELSEALAEYQLNSCITLNVYNPAGQFDVDTAQQASNGDWIAGAKEAVSSYEIGDYQKMQVLSANLQEITQRLSTAFMSTGNQRDQERVTAYEIMMNANEAEQVLGGVYSQLSQNMHLPLAYLLLHEEIPSFITAANNGELELRILTGLQALSRSSENQGLVTAAAELNAVVGVFQIDPSLDPKRVVSQIFAANNVDISQLRFTEEELRKKEQDEQQQQQQLAQQQLMMQSGQAQAVDAVQQAQGIM